MLNRLYIVVGVLAILALTAAFILPRFIQWGDYRERLEGLASEALGSPVEILGEIEFSLLPAPQIRFTDVAVGPAEEPVVMVAGVHAEFSLFDFLRDRYVVTELVLDQPRLELSVDKSGALVTGLSLAEQVSASNVMIENAEIVAGTVRLSDTRTGDVVEVTEIGGLLRLGALRGPFAFQGSGNYEGESYGVRFQTSASDAEGNTSLTAFLRPESDAFSLAAEGMLAMAPAPRFVGDISYRQRPARANAAENVQGDLVVTSAAEISAEQVLLSAYTIVPDENRAGTRLTGAAMLRLGAGASFNAVVSGGVVALAPRDATEEQEVAPYELVRLLAELPLPPVPPLPGTVGVDIVELNLRAVALREVRFDAITNAKSWTLQDFSALLPGNAALKLSGEVTESAGRPQFSGGISLSTRRLDSLAMLWRKPMENNPLFNVEAAMTANVELAADKLTLSDGTFLLEETTHGFSAVVGLGEHPELEFTASFSELSPDASLAIAALAPEVTTDQTFGVTFPRGHVTLTAERASLLGLDGMGLVADGTWEGGVVELQRLAAADLGGAQFDLQLTAFGTLAHPEISGGGDIAIAAPDAPVLEFLYNSLNVPDSIRAGLAQQLPADLVVRLEPPAGDGAQALSLVGSAGAAELELDTMMTAGIMAMGTAPLALRLQLTAEDGAALTEQLGLGQSSLFPQTGPMSVSAVAEGAWSTGLEATILLQGGGDSVGFAGNVVPGGEQWTGSGIVRAALSDPAPLADALGFAGLHVPALSGTGAVEFDGLETVSLGEIEVSSGEQGVTGSLLLKRGVVSGELALGDIEAAGLLAALAGPAALIGSGDGVWPDGPVSAGDTLRSTSGRIAVTAPTIDAGGTLLVTDASFDFAWDESSVRLRELTGELGGGAVALDLGVCCAGPLPDKQLTGRLTLTSADLGTLLPQRLAAVLGGTLSAGAQFTGAGASLNDMIAALAGEGSFSVEGLRVEGFAPQAFASIAGLDNILEVEPEALTTLVAQALEQGAFTSPEIAGSFVVAGGVLRSANLAADGPGARLFGGASIDIADLSLEGSYTLTPQGSLGPDDLINETTSRVTALIGGTILSPERVLDVSTMVDGIKVRAYEIELQELERLRAEDEARVAAAQAERARILAEEEAARKAEEAVRMAQESARAVREAIARMGDFAGSAWPGWAGPQDVGATPVESPSFLTLPPLTFTPTESPNQF